MQLMHPRQHRVLVVDDDPLMTEFVKLRLGQEGFAVEIAHDAKEALAGALRTRHHVFLLDLSLPEVDGLALLRRLKAERTLAHTPAIMLTASALDANVKAATVAGAVNYVIKPFSSDDLLQRVRSAIKNHSRNG